MTQANRDWQIDLSKLPQSLELQLSPRLLEHIANQARATGRSSEEIIIEMLDRGLSMGPPMADNG